MLPFASRALIVSCQPVSGGPLDRPEIVIGFALAAEAGGARGLRIEGIERVVAVRKATSLPIIGIAKRDLPELGMRITPSLEDVAALADAGADIIAFDATARPHPIAPADLCEAIRKAGKLAMADISSAAEARQANDFGADLIATTLSGYTGGAVPEEPDFALIREIAKLRNPVIAEGRIRTPRDARNALDAGAHAVVVGSAITRPEHVTEWFVRAMVEK